ncbi:BrnT family toxin [Janthinobacterium sp. SUN120]|uniref:BrnT family toxin n=1 Tax=Janthinobacterium sp. SUN120 TaxID=3004099 RepID=UPI0025B09619|nr:BrnT family toxin [Janthinobacterium sp. SUN120]MDN2717763.1 BrnT family toxin [Janthinobacterium sp. SUN120]
MRITFDAVKREKTLRDRGLDFARAHVVFGGLTITLPDQRQDYGEPRFITASWLDERLVVLVWTPRGRARRIISMRKANEREIDKYKQSLD